MKEQLAAFWAKYWWIILIVVAVIVIVLVVYYTIFNSGKKSGLQSVLSNIPNPAIGDPITPEESLQIRSLTNSLEKMMSGFAWTIFWSDYSPITQLSESPSRIQLGVYEQYKIDRPDTSLIDDINSLKSLNPDFDQLRTTLIAQLQNLINGQ
jgi:hypothetical protein